jgi:predicted nucleotide-binding protein
MKKTKRYNYCRFSSDVVQEGLAQWKKLLPDKARVAYCTRTTEDDDERWNFDSEEEFFAAYRKECALASINMVTTAGEDVSSFNFWFRDWYCHLEVALPSRPSIERVFDIFEKNVEASRIAMSADPTPPRPTIFIGHGRSSLWRDLKDHLSEKHGYRISAYEVGARAGHTIRDILEDMLVESSFALIVLTAEDTMGTGKLRARQNVVHELGLFQGRLGFPRAIAVVEHGTELMSNLDGIQQLRFSSGNIAEVYGDVLATLRREFGEIH